MLLIMPSPRPPCLTGPQIYDLIVIQNKKIKLTIDELRSLKEYMMDELKDGTCPRQRLNNYNYILVEKCCEKTEEFLDILSELEDECECPQQISKLITQFEHYPNVKTIHMILITLFQSTTFHELPIIEESSDFQLKLSWSRMEFFIHGDGSYDMTMKKLPRLRDLECPECSECEESHNIFLELLNSKAFTNESDYGIFKNTKTDLLDCNSFATRRRFMDLRDALLNCE